MSASSPKWSPGPRLPTSLPPTETVACPSATTKKPTPLIVPSCTGVVPGFSVRSWHRPASFRICRPSRSAKSGTRFRSSASSAIAERSYKRLPDALEVPAPQLLRERRQDVVPDRGERAGELRDPRRARHEPDVEVLRAVAPAAAVNVADPADRVDRTLHPDEQRAELRLVLHGQIVELVVVARLEDDDGREPARLRERRDEPALARPEGVGPAVRAAPAVDAALTAARRLPLDRLRERAGGQRAGERPRLPVGDGRHAERVVRALPELLRRLRHRPRPVAAPRGAS